MPVYAYKGVSNSGKSLKGTVSAESLRAARTKMRMDGVFLTDIAEATKGTAKEDSGRGLSMEIRLPRRIPTAELAIATRQLATLTGAGIPLVESLSALVQQIEHQTLKSVFSEVRDKVNEGSSLADALVGTGKFDNLYLSMIRAGEAGGALDRVLDRIADHLEDSVRLSSRITSIMVYPAAMLGFTGLVVVVLVTVVLPQITSLLESLDADLPFITQVIIDTSDFVRAWWAVLLPGTVVSILGLYSLAKTEKGSAFADRATLRLPIIGRVARVVAIARFSRTLSSLLSSGVNIIQSLDIAKHVAGNIVIREVIEEARTNILEGASLAAPLKASGQFPPMVITMIEVGERSGELEGMLGKVADTYDEQVEATITRFTSLLEPLLILVMVGVVLFIVMATLSPLLDITNSLQ